MSERTLENIIFGLKEELKELKAENERLKSFIDFKTANIMCDNCKQQIVKAETERLTEENGQLKGYNSGLEYENAELQKQVDELKEQLKSVQGSCKSKNAKIKTLQDANDALKNELNSQNGKPHYRYVIWNTKQNKRQFPSICELSENGAYTKLFQKIGWDSAKYRFEVRRIKIDSVEVE